MSRTFRTVYRILLVLLVTLAIIAGFWFGLVPQRLSPFSPLSLETRPNGSWTPGCLCCATILRSASRFSQAPHIDASPIPDNPIKNGCGWTNAVRFSTTGGAKIGVEPLTCEMAAAVTLWVEHEVQPLAMEMFGKRVTSLGDMGTYDCRNIVGNPFWKGVRSQHATANALDISGFTLEDGRQHQRAARLERQGPGREVPARSAPSRVPLFPRDAGAGVQRGAQEPFPSRPRDTLDMQVGAGVRKAVFRWTSRDRLDRQLAQPHARRGIDRVEHGRR